MSDHKPALTASEWGKWSGRGKFRSLDHTVNDPNELYVHTTTTGQLVLPDAHFEWCVEGRARHALAALALYGQPFGFTQADVDALLEDAQEWNDRSDIFAHRADRLRDLATRIQSLVNPGKTNTGSRLSAHDP